jgi:hypothetical protein
MTMDASTLALLRTSRAKLGALALAWLTAMACASASTLAPAAPAALAGVSFQGTWTAVGRRTAIPLGGGRSASISDFNGSLVLTEPSRAGAGFRANAIVLSDNATGVIGRAVWTDARGDQIYSEFQGRSGGGPFAGSFIGGSGRYAGARGSYAFSWRFLLDGEDGQVQGQSTGLKGQVWTRLPPDAPPSRRAPP